MDYNPVRCVLIRRLGILDIVSSIGVSHIVSKNTLFATVVSGTLSTSKYI